MMFQLLLLLNLVRSTAQTAYPCDPTASCGCSKSSATVGRIVGGESAATDTWGWAVSISIADTWLCGGSIISSSWIVTAAHCLVNATPGDVFVSAGTNELFGGEEWREASAVFVHPEYDDIRLYNDIALIQVSPPWNMQDSGIAQICLPSVTTNDYPPNDVNVVAIGWGLLRQNGSVATTLQQVTLQTTRYSSSRCNPMISNRSMQFCAGVSDGSKDTCQGDSGGPLMLYTATKQWVIVGITSYGYDCANPYVAGVYTRLTYHLGWIRSMNVTGAFMADVLSTTASPRSMIITGDLPSTPDFSQSMTTAMTTGRNRASDSWSWRNDIHRMWMLLPALILLSVSFAY